VHILPRVQVEQSLGKPAEAVFACGTFLLSSDSAQNPNVVHGRRRGR
jgi:hypothetical protein